MTWRTELQIGGRPVGPGHPVFVVAEIGINHDGDAAQAARMVEAAAEAGADAVKFQVFDAASFVSTYTGKARHQAHEESVLAMWKRLQLDEEEIGGLFDAAKQANVIPFASALDEASLDLLQRLGCPCYKVASGDITYPQLITKMAATGRPVVLSVGMATEGEIEGALAAVAATGNDQAALLQCVSAYPTAVQALNLRKVPALARAYKLPVGLSDHSTSRWTPAAAVALGAAIIERHFTIDRGLPGPDHQMSTDPALLRDIVAGIREVEAALGDDAIGPAACEEEGRTLFRRSVVAARDMDEGTTLAAADVRIKRPATGVAPAELNKVVGRTLRRGVQADEPIGWDAL